MGAIGGSSKARPMCWFSTSLAIIAAWRQRRKGIASKREKIKRRIGKTPRTCNTERYNVDKVYRHTSASYVLAAQQRAAHISGVGRVIFSH